MMDVDLSASDDDVCCPATPTRIHGAPDVVPTSLPISLKHNEYDYNENAKVDVDEDDIHLGDVKIGTTVINGCLVVDVQVDAKIDYDLHQVEIRKWITLSSGAILISTFIKKIDENEVLPESLHALSRRSSMPPSLPSSPPILAMAQQ